MTTPYGVQGCRCWPDEDGRIGGRWAPNAHCPYHGILPRDRQDTGEYLVVTKDTTRPGAREFFENGGVLAPGWTEARNDTDAPERVVWPPSYGEWTPSAPVLAPCPLVECDYVGQAASLPEAADVVVKHMTTHQTEQKERGVLAALRRWWRGRYGGITGSTGPR